jgi:hypothetical protein
MPAQKELFIPINHFKNTSTPFPNTCCAVKGRNFESFLFEFHVVFSRLFSKLPPM